MQYEYAAELMAAVQRGERPEIPQHCPEQLADFIQACWQGEPENRPSPHHVLFLLDELHKNIGTFPPLFEFSGIHQEIPLCDEEASIASHNCLEISSILRKYSEPEVLFNLPSAPLTHHRPPS